MHHFAAEYGQLDFGADDFLGGDGHCADAGGDCGGAEVVGGAGVVRGGAGVSGAAVGGAAVCGAAGGGLAADGDYAARCRMSFSSGPVKSTAT